MTWTNEFISRALDGLPKDKYRQRAQAELMDHLLELETELEASGLTPEAAQSRAVELMGDSAQLNSSFRTQWVQWAKSWKYCIATLWKAALHALLFNVFFRWICVMPLLLAGDKLLGNRYLIDILSNDPPVYFVLFSALNFLPGIWFIVHELNDLLALHPRRKALLFLGVLSAWFFDVGPFLGGIFSFFMVFFVPVVFVGQFTLVFLAWESPSRLFWYLVLSLTFGLILAFIYHPKRDRAQGGASS